MTHPDTLTIYHVSMRREMLAIADSRQAINANIEQKVSMFASLTYPNPSTPTPTLTLTSTLP
jgi:hypothetical protein